MEGILKRRLCFFSLPTLVSVLQHLQHSILDSNTCSFPRKDLEAQYNYTLDFHTKFKTFNYIPVKPLWHGHQTLSQRSDLVNGLASETTAYPGGISAKQCGLLLKSNQKKIILHSIHCQQQTGRKDCRLFAIANRVVAWKRIMLAGGASCLPYW